MNAAVEFPWRATLESTPAPAAADAVWVEVLDDSGQAAGALELLTLPAVIRSRPQPGLGLAGAPQIPQPQGVSLSRSASGTLWAQPLAHTRVAFNGGPPSGLAHEFEAWALIRIGHQRYRVVNQGFRQAPPDTQNEATAGRVSRWWMLARRVATPMALMTSLVLALLMLAFADWLSDSRQSATLVRSFMAQRDTALALLGWYSAWCALCWRLCGATRWRAHGRLLVVAMGLYSVAAPSLPLLEGYFSWPIPWPVYALAGAACLALAAAAHLVQVPLSSKRRRQLSLVLALIGAAFVAKQVYAWSVSDRTVPESPASLPVSLGLDRAEPMDLLFQRVEALKPMVDTARTEKPKR